MENAVAVVKQQEFSVAEVREQVNKVQALMKEVMQDGVHYGKSYPGDTKKNLLKPGADKLCFTFRLRPDFAQEIKALPDGHMEVLTKCQIYHIESGSKIAEGVGIASTMESKYRWRNAGRACPICGAEAIKVSKYEGGFYCWSKIGGCGAQFKEDDKSITGQVAGRVENPDIADQYNTVLKVSKKRAYVDATITACSASDIFSQDAEDHLNGEGGEEPAEKPAGNGNALASKAAGNGSGEKPAENGSHKQAAPQNRNKPDEAKKVTGDSIAVIMKAASPDGLPFFTEEEKAREREIYQKSDAAAVKKQYERLSKELEKRKAEFKPVPFGDPDPDTMPAMHTQPEEEFKDDIPWDKPGENEAAEEMDIF